MAKKVETKKTNATVTLTEIAKSLKMDPKVARRKMRDNWEGRRPKEGWKFAPSQKAAVVKVLKA